MNTHTAQAQADGDPGVQSTTDRVIAEIAATLDLMAFEVIPTADLRRDFGAKNHDLKWLAASLSEAFGLNHIPEGIYKAWRTVADVIAFIEQMEA